MKISKTGTSGNIPHLTAILLKVEVLILKNKILLSENRVIGIILSVIILLSLLTLRYKYINEDHPLIFLIANLIPVITPIYLARLYLIKSFDRNAFLKSFRSNNEIVKAKQIISLIITIGIFVLLVLFGFKPFFKSEVSNLAIFVEVIFLIPVSIIMPLTIRERKSKIKRIFLPDLWKISLSSLSALPVRAVVFRDFYYLIRINRSAIFSFLVFVFISNTIYILFVLNNNYTVGFIWGLILQLLYIFSHILDYSSDNNVELLKINKNYVLDILKGEFLSLSILLFMYLTAVVIMYNYIKSEINIIQYMLVISLSMIILIYTLLIRITSIYNGIFRKILFTLGLFPLFFPIVIFYCLRRLKCLS